MISPKCVCGHSKSRHGENDERAFSDGCLVKVPTRGAGNTRYCECTSYRPKRLAIRRVYVPRRSPLKRTKRKILPKCKHCAHRYAQHLNASGTWLQCSICVACPGYAPARGIRQKRRTPLAAKRQMADDLWRDVVHARPEACEVQRYYPHTCTGGPQAMHGVPRTFQATRYWPINGFKGCAGIHKFFTDRPELWSAILLEAWGLETYRSLWNTARAMQPVDLEATVARLREELAKVQA